jgi:hypothetical protein
MVSSSLVDAKLAILTLLDIGNGHEPSGVSLFLLLAESAIHIMRALQTLQLEDSSKQFAFCSYHIKQVLRPMYLAFLSLRQRLAHDTNKTSFFYKLYQPPPLSKRHADA